MAVIVRTDSPNALRERLLNAVRHGRVDDWSVDDEGDLTLRGLLRNKAWMRPTVGTGRLSFFIVSPRGAKVSVSTYASFHARLTEVLLGHFDKEFERVEATALPSGGDAIG